MRRGILTLLLGGLLGLALGLYIGWVAYPVELVDVAPAALAPRVQEDYLRMIAATYAGDNDFAAARRRLADLGRPDTLEWVRARTVDAVLAGEDEREIRQLVNLAAALGIQSPAMAPYLPTAAPTAETDAGE